MILIMQELLSNFHAVVSLGGPYIATRARLRVEGARQSHWAVCIHISNKGLRVVGLRRYLTHQARRALNILKVHPLPKPCASRLTHRVATATITKHQTFPILALLLLQAQ